MDEILKRDQNSAVVLGGVTDDASQLIRMLRVDPVTNRLLVSGTGGGGGFTKLTATGTVNGSNTAFTFTSAPSVIVVDQGRTMQQVSSDGTVNWTGTTSVTLSIAPNFDIFGY